MTLACAVELLRSAEALVVRRGNLNVHERERAEFGFVNHAVLVSVVPLKELVHVARVADEPPELGRRRGRHIALEHALKQRRKGLSRL